MLRTTYTFHNSISFTQQKTFDKIGMLYLEQITEHM